MIHEVLSALSAAPVDDFSAGAQALLVQYALAALGALLAAGWAWGKRKLRLTEKVDAFLTVGVNHVEPEAKAIKADAPEPGLVPSLAREQLIDRAVEVARQRAKVAGEKAVVAALDATDAGIRAKVITLSQKLKGFAPPKA